MRELVERVSGSIDTLRYSISKYEAANFLFLELSEISFFPTREKAEVEIGSYTKVFSCGYYML